VRGLRLLVLGLAILAAACDLRVTNPSKIKAEDLLEDPSLLHAIVVGAVSDVGYAALVPSFGGVVAAGGLLSDELVATSTRQGLRAINDGRPRDDYSETREWWAAAARARWTAETAYETAKRLSPTPDSDPEVATAALYAGLANRLSGDNFCHAVINGGPLEPTSVNFERAVGYFTAAIEVATAAGLDSIVTAAYGGRAQAHMMLGNWSAAVADARHVPTNFVFRILNTSQSRNLNYIWSYTRGSVKHYTVWGTPFADWGVDYTGARPGGDPRVIVEPRPDELGPDNRRPLILQRKYTGTATSVALIKGSEMRLIAAEAELVAGNWSAAIDSINALRTALNAAPPSSWGSRRLTTVSAANAQEAWEVLMQERGMELWLEGRRLADYRRWANVPGQNAVPFRRVREPANSPDPEDDPRVSVYQVDELCLPVSLTEKLANPNIGVGGN